MKEHLNLNFTFISFVLTVGIALIPFYFVLCWLYTYLRIRYYLWNIPGPKGHVYPIGNLMQLIHPDERLFNNMRKWGLEFYPLYTLNTGPSKYINVVGPDEIEQIISTTKHLSKSVVYKMLMNWLGEGLLTGTGKKWHTRRKILTPAFHFNILQHFISIFNKETDKLVQNYLNQCGNSKGITIDVITSVTEFTLHTINETSMGTTLDDLNSEAKIYKDSIYAIGPVLLQRMVRPWLWNDWVYIFTVNGLKERKLVKTLHKITNNIIAKRSENFKPFLNENNADDFPKKKVIPLLDILLNAKFLYGNIDDEGIREEVDTFMFEGHDTTSMGICLGLMLLANNPQHQKLIFEEIEQVLGKNNSSPTYEQLNELKYMERCIKEILRIYPSVPFISRLISEDVVTKSGYKIPKDTIANIHIYDLHHSPYLYKDPEKFDPDRFLPENIEKRHPFAYLPFSAGPRNCIGQRFAMLEYKALLCGILRNFKLEPITTPENIVFIPDLVLRPKNAVTIKFVRKN